MWFKDKNAFVGRRFKTAADTRELLELHTPLAESFAARAESRDGAWGKAHIERVKQLTGILARAMLAKNFPDFTGEYADNIILASPLHDIGKIAVRDEILAKKGELSARESDELALHTIEGEKILGEIAASVGGGTYIGVAAAIARSHHERWNGSGYPDRLKGGQIPLPARMVAITDGFDCLVSAEYIDRLGLDEAMTALRELAGVYYDAALTDIFLSEPNKIKEVYRKD